MIITPRDRVTVVGAGISGLVTAIELAEHGLNVEVFERRPQIGGLATTATASTTEGSYRTNIGPRALYTNNPLFPWLARRRLLPPLAKPRLRDLRSFGVVEQNEIRGAIPVLATTLTRLRVGEAPPELSFRDWATPKFGDRVTERLVALASLPLFHHDPGRLSAHSVHHALRSAYLDGKVTYVRAGWSELTSTLTSAAGAAGVEIHTGADITEVPDGQVVLAIPLPAARRLLADPSLEWPSEPTALLDIGMEQGHDRAAVFGLDTCVYAARYTRWDTGLAPPGHDLVQAQAGMRPDERLDRVVERIEAHLDLSYPTWRTRERWRHRALLKHGAGPADPPGSTWRDRPAVDRGDGVHLVNDRISRPGLLSAVAVTAALDVAAELISRRNR